MDISMDLSMGISMDLSMDISMDIPMDISMGRSMAMDKSMDSSHFGSRPISGSRRHSATTKSHASCPTWGSLSPRRGFSLHQVGQALVTSCTTLGAISPPTTSALLGRLQRAALLQCGSVTCTAPTLKLCFPHFFVPHKSSLTPP